MIHVKSIWNCSWTGHLWTERHIIYPYASHIQYRNRDRINKLNSCTQQGKNGETKSLIYSNFEILLRKFCQVFPAERLVYAMVKPWFCTCQLITNFLFAVLVELLHFTSLAFLMSAIEYALLGSRADLSACFLPIIFGGGGGGQRSLYISNNEVF